jgi:hypothetical protein
MWNLVSICFETVLASVQDRCSVCVKCTIGSLIVFEMPAVLLGDEAQVEARFGPFWDSASLDARLVLGLCNTLGIYHQLSSGFKLKHDRSSGDEDVKVNLWR